MPSLLQNIQAHQIQPNEVYGVLIEVIVIPCSSVLWERSTSIKDAMMCAASITSSTVFSLENETRIELLASSVVSPIAVRT